MIEVEQESRLVILNAPVNELVRRRLNSKAELNGVRPRDLLHEILCAGLDSEDLLPYSPRALEARSRDSITDDEPEQRQAG